MKMNHFPKWIRRVSLEVLSVVIVFSVLHYYLIQPYIIQLAPSSNSRETILPDSYTNNSSSKKVNLNSSPKVPELVHFIWIYPPNTEFEFYQMVCVLAVMKHIKPKGVVFWNNNRPVGKWWKFARQIVPNMALWELDPVTQIYNKTVTKPEHQSDVARIEILLKYGGIYVDFDVIILKSFKQFYKNKITMGAENPNLLGSGIIIATRNASFLHLWKETYKSFNDLLWNFHSVKEPMEIAKQNPSLVHIEWFGFHRPNWFEREWLFKVGKLWDWSQNYAIHLWYRTHGTKYNPFNIRCLNTTTGEILRYIYYGNSSFISPC